MENEFVQSNQYYHEKISQLLADSQRHFLALKDDYQKCLKLISKDNSINDCVIQKVNEIVLFSTDPTNQNEDDIFRSLEMIQNENKELNKVYEYLFSLLERKTKTGEIPNFIQFCYIDLQSKLNQNTHQNSSLHNDHQIKSNKFPDSILTNTEDISNLSSKTKLPQSKKNIPLLQAPQSILSFFCTSASTPSSPKRHHTNKISFHKEIKKSQKKLANTNDIGTFQVLRAKENHISQSSSPSRLNSKKSFYASESENYENSITNDSILTIDQNSDDDNNETSSPKLLRYEKAQAKSLLNFNTSKNNSPNRKRHNNLSIRSKYDLLNRASTISFNVSRLNDISNLSDQVSIHQKKLEKLDYQIKKLKTTLNTIYQNQILKNSQSTLQKNVLIFNSSEYTDREVNCEPIANLSKMKAMIMKNAGEKSQQLLAIQQLQDLQNYLDQLKIELKVIILANDRKKSDFNNIIASLKAVDPLFYADIQSNTDKFASKMIELKEEKEKRLKAIENRIFEMQKQNDQINARCNDLLFTIENYKKQRMRMIQIPKANVQNLCISLKNERLIVNENNRQYTFVKIIQSNLEKKIAKLNERYSNQSFEKIGNEITALKSKVNDLKNKFDHLRAARENHSFVLTNQNELKFLHAKVRDLISAIDVEKMRTSGLISKVEKQTKLLIQQQIPLPIPPHSLIAHQENVMKKKNTHS